MSWIALHRSEEAEALLEKHPNALLLLLQIAMRARYHDEPCPITKLGPGEAMIGDWRRAGLPSEKAYRVAKQVLLEGGLVVFKGANKGTVAKLVSSRVFSIQADVQGRTKGEPRDSLGATNNKETKNKVSKGHATEEEIVDFVVSLGLPKSDGVACFNKWVGNGWKNGSNPIKDWKATIRSWNAAGYLPSQKGGGSAPARTQWRTD